MGATAIPRPRPARVDRSLLWSLIPVAIAGALCVLYLLLDLHPVDLAAATYRANLFGDEGFTLWNGNWYGGHYTLSYSVLSPPLAWLIGPVKLGIACALISTALFQVLARRHFGNRALLGTAWFAVAAATLVFHGRVPFAAGLSFGLAALLALQRGWRGSALVLAAVTGLTSPVAGLFLALAGVSIALADRRREGFALAAAAMLPVLALEVAFPEGGHQPFPAEELAFLLASCAIALILLPRSERALRLGAWLYGAGGLATYAFSTPLGNNVYRLAPLVTGPLIVCALAARGRHRRAVVVAALLALLAFFQLKPVVEDVTKVRSDPLVEPSYYRPLIGFLDRAGGPPFRVEIPFTRAHWEATEVGRRFPLARGWERQIDSTRNPLFYGGALNTVTYRRWLADHGVRFVAVARGRLDSSSYKERTLINTGLPYLRPAWRSKDWRVYEFTLPHPIVIPRSGADMALTRLGQEDVAIDVRRPGTADVKVHWTPYWLAAGACVERAGEWTRVTARRPGPLRLTIDFSPERILSHGRRCA
jgi:hypothetical protein